MSDHTDPSAARHALLQRYLRGEALPARENAAPVEERSARHAPLSFAQQRLWFLQQLDPSTTVANLVATLRLNGALNVEALRHSIAEIVRRHDILRTTFPSLDGGPVQAIAPVLTVPLPLVDLHGLPASTRAAELSRLVTRETHHVFDLMHGPLLRTTLIQIEPEVHVLLLALHHIVFDGWSIDIFLAELTALYAAFVEGRPSPLPNLSVQYADIAREQREQARRGGLDPHLDYWSRQLAGAPPALDLPADHPRPGVYAVCGARRSAHLTPDLTHALIDLSRQEGVTLFMLLLAAFQTLLFRYTGQDDILVGVPVAGRTRARVDRLIGLFVNTLVLRGDLSGAPSTRDLLARTRTAVLDAHAHQAAPFERVVEVLRPERNLSRPPLFQTMFNLTTTDRHISLQGLEVEVVWALEHTAQVDLTLYADERDGRLHLDLLYNTLLFADEAMARLLEHLRRLLAGMVADPATPVDALPLLTMEERGQLLTWGASMGPAPTVATIQEMLETQAMRVPNEPAVICANEQVTYRELHRQAYRVARRLQELNAGPGTLVGLCGERSSRMVAGILGILAVGAAYLPLDPAYPAERLAFMLKDANARVVLADHVGREALPADAPHVLSLEMAASAREHGEDEPDGSLASGATADSLAYVIYTSGVTGRPKGVEVLQRNLVHSTAARLTYYREPVGRYLLLSPIAFDSSVAGLFWTLCTGGALCLPADAEAGDPARLVELVDAWSVTHLLAVPTLYARLLAMARAEQLQTLRTVIVAGESCPGDLARTHDARLSRATLYNEYGPTEGTVWSTVHRSVADDHGSASVPIGRPIANTRAYILDARGELVPRSVAGELAIGGAGVAHGYRNRPALTAERFLPDPFDPRPGARLYRTGDLARWRSDGTLAYLGRRDRQVKLRGYRIELGEIEAVLAAHPAVRESVVVAREDRPDDMRLVAYVVGQPGQGQNLTMDALRRLLQERLPAYMVPAACVVLDALPLTPNGKLDRAALPPPYSNGTAERDYVAPCTSDEERLAALWAEALGVPRVSRDDDFFALGGHSLLAAHLAARMRAEWAIDLPLGRLLATPSLAGMAAAITTIRMAGSAEGMHPRPALRPVARESYRTRLSVPPWSEAASEESEAGRDG